MNSVLTCSIEQEEGVIKGIKANLTAEGFTLNSIDLRIKQDSDDNRFGIPEGMAAAMLHLMSEPAEQVVFEEDESAVLVFDLMDKYMKEEVAANWAIKQ